MAIDPTKLQMSSKTVSLKIQSQGNGVLVVPPTTNSISATATIPHNFGNTNLLWQVLFSVNYGSGPVYNYATPFATGDGKLQVVSTIDSTNLYITGNAFTGVGITPNTTLTYSYRVIVP